MRERVIQLRGWFTCWALALAFVLIGAASASSAKMASTSNAVNLRSGPGTSHPVLSVIPANVAVTVHSCNSDRSWCDVNFAGQRGYVAGNYLFDLPSSAKPVAPPAPSAAYCDSLARDYATRNSRGKVAGGAAAGAIGGALIGGAIRGRRGARRGAAIGGGTGAVAGGVAQSRDYTSLYNRAYSECMGRR